MLNKTLVRLLALVTLLAVGGCNHLPTLGSLSFFSEPNPADTDILVVESMPVAPAMQPASIPDTRPQPTLQPSSTAESGPMLASSPVSPVVLPVALPTGRNSSSANNAVALGDTQGVLDLPPTYWAVQIAAVRNIEKVAEMVKEHELQGMLGVPMNTQAGPLHAVLTGVFVKREDAVASVENLPAVLAGYQPWIRPLAHLQAAMR